MKTKEKSDRWRKTKLETGSKKSNKKSMRSEKMSLCKTFAKACRNVNSASMQKKKRQIRTWSTGLHIQGEMWLSE